MRLDFHSQVASDVARIMHYYEDVAGRQLADEFYSELRSRFQKAADSPEVYDIRTRDLRRVNLERFPYHFLFRMSATECAFWLCVITGDDYRWVFIGANQNYFPF